MHFVISSTSFCETVYYCILISHVFRIFSENKGATTSEMEPHIRNPPSSCLLQSSERDIFPMLINLGTELSYIYKFIVWASPFAA